MRDNVTGMDCYTVMETGFLCAFQILSFPAMLQRGGKVCGVSVKKVNQIMHY